MVAHAFVVGENFVGDEDVCLILGDNIFYGQAFTNMLLCSIEKASKRNSICIWIPCKQS